MAEMASATYQEDITKCAVCLETFNDPRELSCIHTFCLKCLEGLMEKKNPDAEAEHVGRLSECPLCSRKIAPLPGGLAALPRNSFVQQLLDVKQLSAALTESEILCDVCSDDKGKNVSTEVVGEVRRSRDEAETAKAVVYCIECCKKLCGNCSGYHGKFVRSHKLIMLGGQQQQSAGELLMLLPEKMCDKHPEKNLEIYCMECKVAVCYLCHIKSHRMHECSDVKDVADELSKKIKEDNEGIDKKMTECEEMLARLTTDEKEFLEKLEKTETEILDKCEEMKKLIEDHKSKLIAELDEAKAKQVKQVAAVRQELEEHLKMLNNFKKYSDELREKGKACDVAKSAGRLTARAKELLEFNVEKDLKSKITSVEIKFVSHMPVQDSKKVFGIVEIKVNVAVLKGDADSKGTKTMKAGYKIITYVKRS